MAPELGSCEIPSNVEGVPIFSSLPQETWMEELCGRVGSLLTQREVLLIWTITPKAHWENKNTTQN